MTTIHNHNPQIQAKFETRTGLVFTVDRIAAYQSLRLLADPIAKATLVLYGDGMDLGLKQPLAQTLSDYDLCTVTMVDGEGKRHRDIVGLVKSVQTGKVEQGGRPNTVTTIVLSGLGEALQFYQIYWLTVRDPSRLNVGGLGYKIRSKGTVPKGRPDDVISHIYQTFISDTYQMQFANSRFLREMIDLRFEEIPDSLNTVGIRAMMDMASLWSVMSRAVDAPWNEFFLALPPGGMTTPEEEVGHYNKNRVGLYLRPTPFDLDRWDALKLAPGWHFVYEDSERMGAGEQLAHDSGKIYNLFWTTATGLMPQATQQASAYDHSNKQLPIVDEESVKRLGLRRMECQTQYVFFSTEQSDKQGALTPQQQQGAKTRQQDLYAMLVKKTKALQRWFGYDKFSEGQIQMRGRIGGSRTHGGNIGSVLTRQRDGWEGYITGVAQQWQFPGPHMTTFQCSRFRDPRDYAAWVAFLG